MYYFFYRKYTQFFDLLTLFQLYMNHILGILGMKVKLDKPWPPVLYMLEEGTTLEPNLVKVTEALRDRQTVLGATKHPQNHF